MLRFVLSILLFFQVSASFSQDSVFYVTPEQSKVDINLNQYFIIKLRSCHSCGYHWNLNEVDTLKIKLISVRSENASGNKFQRGGDVYEFWKFIGKQVGLSNLEFVQKGPARDYRENGRCRFEILVK